MNFIVVYSNRNYYMNFFLYIFKQTEKATQKFEFQNLSKKTVLTRFSVAKTAKFFDKTHVPSKRLIEKILLRKQSNERSEHFEPHIRLIMKRKSSIMAVFKRWNQWIFQHQTHCGRIFQQGRSFSGCILV